MNNLDQIAKLEESETLELQTPKLEFALSGAWFYLLAA
jgi:hypothetical protein